MCSKSRVRVLWTLCVAAFVGAAGSGQSSLPVEGLVIASDGAAAPGLPGLAFGGSVAFDLPVIDALGFVAFRGRVVGPGVTAANDRAVFAGPCGGDLCVVVRSGDPAPGLPGVTMNGASGTGIGGNVRLHEDGGLLVGVTLSGSGIVASSDTALVTVTNGVGAVVAREGDPAPGTNGAVFASQFGNPLQSATGFSRSGRVVFQSALALGDATPSNDVGWFAAIPGYVELIQRKGHPTPIGAVAAAIGSTAQVNDLDQVLYAVTLQQDATTSPGNDETLWIHTPGLGGVLALREGDYAAGCGGATYGNPTATWAPAIGVNAFARTGAFAFASDLVGGDAIPGVNDRGVFAGPAGALTLVARKGDAAPGTDAVFGTQSGGSLSLNADGAVVFQSTLSGGSSSIANDTGIWTGGAATLTLVAREGAPAPGAGGALFGSFSGALMHFNDRGQVVFVATLTGPGVTGPANNTALYAFDPTIGLALLLRGGDSFAIAPGVVKTVAAFGSVAFGNGDGAALAFDHAGDLVLRVGMTDATAAIVKGHVGPLFADRHVVSASTGGVVTLRLRGSAARAGYGYFLGGSASGTSPGFVAGGVHVPLNPDLYTWLTIQLANTLYLGNTLGVLDASGQSVATIAVPAGQPSLAGLVVHHAFGVLDVSGLPCMASEPARLEIVP